MLLKNEQTFRPDDLPKKTKKPQYYKLSKKTWNPLNKCWDIKAGFHMDPFYFATIDEENVTIQYALTYQKREKGGAIFTPVEISLNKHGELVVPGENVELRWFLDHHPYNADNVKAGAEKWFYLEDLAKEAEPIVARGTQRAKALELIYNEDTGLTYAQRRNLGRAMYPPIPKVDDLSPKELQVELEKRALKSKEDLNTFLRIAQSPDVKYRALVHNAIKYGVLIQSYEHMGYFFCDSEGNAITDKRICNVPPSSEDPVNDIVQHLIDDKNKDVLKLITDQVKDKKQKEKEQEEAVA